MTYSERKARDLCFICGLIDDVNTQLPAGIKMIKIIGNRIDEIIRDTRYKCAESVYRGDTGIDPIKLEVVCNSVMNTNLD